MRMLYDSSRAKAFSIALASSFVVFVGIGEVQAVTPPTVGIGTTTPEATLEAHGAQAGSNVNNPEPVFGLSSTPDQGMTPKFKVYQGRDQYTTGTTTVLNRPLGGITATGNRSYVIDAHVLARCTGGSGANCPGTPGVTSYTHVVGVYRSYNSGANCSIGHVGLDSATSSPAISGFSATLMETGTPCNFGVAATFPANTTIQVNYVLKVMELIDN